MTLKTAAFGSAMVDIIAVLESDSVEQISFSNAHQQYQVPLPRRIFRQGTIQVRNICTGKKEEQENSFGRF